jgi:Ni/Co efflux regulator RcnB
MKRPLVIAALAALGLASTVSSVALADSHGRHRDHDRDRSEYRYDHRDDHRWDRYDRHSHGRYHVVRYVRPAGYREYRWYQGAHLPRAYYAPRYVVRDYSAYRLRPPPRGYHWVRVDNDVVLAAITTGLVMQVVNGIFY